MVREFYTPFHKTIKEKDITLKSLTLSVKKSDEVCELCSSPMVIKLGRFGKFLSCSKYPNVKCKSH